MSQGVLSATRPRWWSRVVGFAGWGSALVMIALLVRLVWYGATVFKDVPALDDWAFVDRLHAFLAGQAGVGYFFERHNGHPSVLARFLFWADERFFGLDVSLLRWISAILLAGTAALAAWAVFADVKRLRADRPQPTAVALIFAAPVVAIVLSLGNWEVFTFSEGVGNVAVNLFAIAAILLADRWRNLGGRLALAGSVICAISATGSMLQGVLVWPCLIITLLAGPPRRGVFAVSGAMFVMFALLSVLVLAGPTAIPTKIVFDQNYDIMAILMLAGTPFLGAINGAPLPTADLLLGGFAIATTLAAVGLTKWRDDLQRRAAAKYLGMLAFAGGVAVLIALGRHIFYPVEQLATSRYATCMTPGAVGLWGLMASLAQRERRARELMVALYLVVIIGVGVTDRGEMRIAPYRALAFEGMQAALRDGRTLHDPVAVRKTFFVGPHFFPLVGPDRDFLKANRLSLFRAAAS